MAVDVGTLVMKFEADDKKIQKSFSGIKSGVAGVAKAAAAGAAVAAAALTGIAVKSIELAKQQELAEARLESIAKKVTKATDEQVDSLKRLAAEYQKITTFGDEVLIAGQSQILSFGTTAKQTEMLTGSLADLLAATKGVTATQDDAINAANMLGKAINGQAGALSRAGILMTEQQEELIKTGTQAERVAAIVDIMNDNYGGLAETLAETTAGQMQQAKNAIGDIGETIGFIFLPKINEMLKVVMENLPAIESFFIKTFEIIGKVIDNTMKFVTPIVNALVFIFMMVGDYIKDVLIPVFEDFRSWVEGNMPKVRSTFDKIIKAIVEVATTLYDFFKDNILPILEELYSWVSEFMPQIKEIFDIAITFAIDILTKLWKFIKENVLPILSTFFSWVQQYMPIIKNIIKNALDIIITAFGVASDAVQFLIDVVLKMYEFFEPTFGAIGGIVKAGLDVVVSAVDSVIGAFKSVIEWVERAIQAMQNFFSVKNSGDFGIPSDGGGFVTSNIPVSGNRANGGSVNAGEGYIVGERGPEKFIPNQSGVIVPNGMNGGGIVININGAMDPELIGYEIVRVLNEQGIR